MGQMGRIRVDREKEKGNRCLWKIHGSRIIEWFKHEWNDDLELFKWEEWIWEEKIIEGGCEKQRFSYIKNMFKTSYPLEKLISQNDNEQ